ncbi:hypothetical protein WJX72_009976 [[Myrmecia] bisecta]|uniref:Uncharacterized protein n=1 Tax=[Myrmecia] bisecta TaxID=41462 RepID=A0AAW1PTJ9_9CHLO
MPSSCSVLSARLLEIILPASCSRVISQTDSRMQAQTSCVPMAAASDLEAHGHGRDGTPGCWSPLVGRLTGLRKEVVDGFDNLYVKETVYQDVKKWECELAYYQRTGVTARTNDGVIGILRRSFDWLSDEQRRMFLDAATILHARPADHLLAVWGSLQGSLPFATAMLGGLQSSSMVVVDGERNLFVHDSLRQLARTIRG